MLPVTCKRIMAKLNCPWMGVKIGIRVSTFFWLCLYHQQMLQVATIVSVVSRPKFVVWKKLHELLFVS